MKFRRFRRPLFVETSSTPSLKALQTMVGILRGILQVIWAFKEANFNNTSSEAI